jgi:predicted DsbA family dithiol-disulfide isomerase
MIIDIVSDVVCPWCYVGKLQLERALALEPQPGLQVTWRPFQLNPDMPEEGMERAAYLRAKFGEDGGGDRYARVRAAGASVGLDFAFDRIRRTPNTLQAHRLIRWSAAIGAQDAMVEALFRAYFLEGEDVGDKATLARIAATVGFAEADAAGYLAGDRDAEALRAEDAFARQVGITGVPCFIVDRKFAISGAQPPEAFIEIFEAARRESDAPEAETA